MSFSNVLWIYDKPAGRRTITKIQWTRGRPLSLQHTLFKKHSGVWCAIQYDSKMYFDSGEQKISLQLLQDAAEQTKGENPIILTYKDPDEPVKSTPGPRGVDLGALLMSLRDLFAEEGGHEMRN